MMKNFGFLIWTLAALSAAEADLLSEGGRWRSSIFSSSSSFSSSLESSGEICLNGGRSVPSLTGEHLFCLCADGFLGRRCETEKGVHCHEGLGLFYRGTVSTSASGRTCEEWKVSVRGTYMSSDVNSGRHNYCRNLFYRRRPWCYVRRNQQLVKEYCDVPRCGLESSAPREPQPAAESTCGQRTRRKQMKIVGGTVATVESHPWIAAIFWQSKSKEKVFRCGGSLISACWVLTAAHCFPDGSQTKARRFSITLGKNALNETDLTVEQTFRVEEIIIHEGFDNSEGNFNNDIALLKLRARHGRCAEESNWVKTVCLPPPQQSLQPGVTCEIAGYGKEKHGLWYRSQYLREAQVNLLTDNMCRHEDYYGNMITDNMFCAGRPDWSQDACEGDSGGPLVCEVNNTLFQFGVISWGDGCAKELRPGVYTRVTNYNRWIEEKTGLTSIAAGAVLPQD
ncbi:plasminogen activator, urokinase b isoform X2 [Toxotes jaculatrix]|uniref:plasminogen activator, urokinase b isoform X2 n=1 Tax=Toxotes jaculatrix TaxID=941984 RepID=UPI001B3A97D1|nr:plasminogen activator, urokinase b isoform X2 [Toxotes jaculatrix]